MTTSPALGGYQELLEVAEAILFSVPLPAGVLDKYRQIQSEVKGRIASASGSPSDDGSLSVTERSLFQEKLSASKRKSAALHAQVVSLEHQVAQLTTKMSSLHAHHKSSLVEVQEQTRHVCEESHARHIAEVESRARRDAALSRQCAEDQLSSERSFHSRVDEKMRSLAQLFPHVFAEVAAEPTRTNTAFSASITLGAGDAHPNSEARLQLTAFFEATRRALNDARHSAADLREVSNELRAAKAALQEADAFRHATEKTMAHLERRVDEITADWSSPRQELDGIIARVDAVERRRAEATAAAAAADAAVIEAMPSIDSAPSSSPPTPSTPSADALSPPTHRSAAPRARAHVSFADDLARRDSRLEKSPAAPRPAPSSRRVARRASGDSASEVPPAAAAAEPVDHSIDDDHDDDRHRLDDSLEEDEQTPTRPSAARAQAHARPAGAQTRTERERERKRPPTWPTHQKEEFDDAALEGTHSRTI